NVLWKLKTSFRALFQKRRVEAEMEEELREHVELQTKENVRAGMSETEARRAAMRQVGWVERLKEERRDQQGVGWLEDIVRDVRLGVRVLRKHPGLTTVAGMTLALGIGATTALFSVIYGVLISPYPYSRPGEIWTPGLRSVSSDQQMRSYRLTE